LLLILDTVGTLTKRVIHLKHTIQMSTLLGKYPVNTPIKKPPPTVIKSGIFLQFLFLSHKYPL